MTLRVLTVAYSLVAVGPGAVGGAEQVVSLIDRELTARGAHSVVVACTGSRVRGTLCATRAPAGVLDAEVRGAAIAEQRHAIAYALERWPADLVHLHGIDFHECLPPPGVPALVTLHLPPAWYSAAALTGGRPDTYFHCVSESQQRQCAPGLPLLPVIPNGVSLSAFRPSSRTGNYVVALGRICPEKGYDRAIDAARRAGVPMLLAGRVFPYPEHMRYLAEEIRPRLDARRRFIGVVSAERKRRLLAGARALLVPSLCAETSSLVAMEALACGTPVVAFANGALPEIVDDAVTGFLVHDAVEMADAIEATRSLDRRACRRVARERFSDERTAGIYLETYATLTRAPESRIAR